MTTYMVSLDTPETNRAFRESVGAELTILSDPDGEAAKAYGVLAPDGRHAKRRTFYIGRDGLIRNVDTKVEPATHGSDLLRMLTSWLGSHEASKGASDD